MKNIILFNYKQSSRIQVNIQKRKEIFEVKEKKVHTGNKVFSRLLSFREQSLLSEEVVHEILKKAAL